MPFSIRLQDRIFGVLLGAACSLIFSGAALGCDSVVIKALSGEVVLTGPDGARLTARPDACVPPGTRFQTGTDGRVTFLVVARDTVIDLDSRSELLLPPGEPGEVTLVGGLLNFLSSVRGQFSVVTPFVTAGIEGTEATVHVSPGDGAVIVTREGVVTPRQAGTSLPGLTAGEVVFAPDAGRMFRVGRDDAARLPELFRPYVIAPENAADWAVYFPAALLADPASPREAEAAARIAARDYPAAAAVLGCGEPGAAGPALCTMLAVALNDRARITALAAGEAAGPAALVARSYALQALGRLPEAREAAAAAAQAAVPGPLRGHALARLAELDLILGDSAAARVSAEAAVAAGAPLGTTLLGFSALSGLDAATAEARFAAAIAAGDASPLPHLGRGLARIRLGRLAEGRQDLETAAALDPERADLRGWLARAYLEEGLVEKAQSQLALAIARDPDDPGPYLTRAGERFAANDPVAALRDIEAAERLAGARATLRGRDGLGEDAAVRSAALGRVFDVLGFEERAVEAGTRAAERDRASPAAQRFLADILRGRPGSEAAQASAYLKYQLLSPPSKDPVQPELGETGLALLDTSGPARVTFAEFAPLFQSNGLRFDLAGTGGTQATLGGSSSLVLLQDRFSFGIGQFHTETDGFRDNNQVRHDVVSAEFRARVSPELTLFGEYRYRDTEAGDRQLEFDFVRRVDDLFSDLTASRLRLGLHAEPAPGTHVLALASLIDSRSRVRQSFLPGFGDSLTVTDRQGADLQLQVIGQGDRMQWTFGAEYLHFSEDVASVLVLPGTVSRGASDADFLSVYGYLDASPLPWLDLTAGLGIDHQDVSGDGAFSQTEINPKLGARVRIAPGLSLRGAWLRGTARRESLAETLEPVSVAGFSQPFLSQPFLAPPGTVADRLGIGIDAAPGLGFRVGAAAELSWRDLPDNAGGQRDQTFTAYVSRSFGDSLAASLGLAWQESWSDAELALIDRYTTVEVPLRLRWFDRSGWFAGVDATLVQHSFRDSFLEGDASGVVVDASLGYRMPGNRGVFTLAAQNIFSAPVRIEEQGLKLDDPAAPRFARDATVLASFRINF